MGIKERKLREKDARRKTILEAAKQIFFQQGFHAATMSRIAEAAELSKGSLYIYFPGKKELYFTILLDGLDILEKKLSKAVKGRKKWDQRLRRVCLAYYEFYCEHRNYFHIMILMQDGQIANGVSDPLFEEIYSRGSLCLAYLVQNLQQGMEQGEIEAGDPAELATVLWGSLNGLIHLYDEEELRKFLPSSLDILINKDIDLFLVGVKTNGGL